MRFIRDMILATQFLKKRGHPEIKTSDRKYLGPGEKIVNSPEKRNTEKTNISYYFIMKSQGITIVLGIGKK